MRRGPRLSGKMYFERHGMTRGQAYFKRHGYTREEGYRRRNGYSKGVNQAANKRKVKFFGDHLWLVWGGERQHVVYFSPDRRLCDCSNWEDACGQWCCHQLAVRNEMERQ